MYLFMIFKLAFPVQLEAALKGSLDKISKGQTITMTSIEKMFFLLCHKCGTKKKILSPHEELNIYVPYSL